MISPAEKFNAAAEKITHNDAHRAKIRAALDKYYVVRDKQKSRFQNWQEARQAAAEIKWEAVNHLDQYLDQFAKNLEKRGTKVFWASNGKQAADYILEVAKRHEAKSIIKSKTMTSEEIHLNDALQNAGYEVVESDLGEFIVQLRGETPYHIVFPSMHLTRDEIQKLFKEKLGNAPSNDPEALTMLAREALREKYCTADIGISGANFAIVETGMISITENEGNARLTTSLPKVHIALLGIEKVLPKLDDLALFLPMLATAGAGQQITGYNTMLGGPRQPGECDGPEEFHVVLLDNHRTRLLADAEQRDALHCIRCGACLNVCPIFKNIGGQSYGTTYSGPIGSVITPHLRGLQDWKHLSAASSLCGACSEACPVKIDLHHHLLQNRRNAAAQKPIWQEKIAFKLFASLMTKPSLYRLSHRLAAVGQKAFPLIKRTPLNPMKAWTNSRELPLVVSESFKDFWKKKQAAARKDEPR